MRGDLAGAAALVLASVAPAASAEGAPPAAPAAAAAGPASAWKQIYENGQIVYYIEAGAVAKTGESTVSSLLEYKIPQVIGGAQVWSIVTHMKLKCGQDQMVTTDNTLYALQMGAGPVVESQPANDSWHAPQAGSLGGLIWSKACGK